MTTYYRMAANSIQADEDRRAMRRGGLKDVVSVPYNGYHGSRYLTFAQGALSPTSTLPFAKLP